MSKEKKVLKPLSIAIGAAFAVSMAASTVATAAPAGDNPFAMSELQSGYMQLAMEGKCGEGKKADMKKKDGKCGEGMKKEKEGKCGGDMKKKKEGKCGGDMKKKKEGKCGGAHMKKKDGKCGESMKKDMKKKEGKCGEGKCGGK